MAKFTLFVDPSTIKAANSSNSFRLRTPTKDENPTLNTARGAGKEKWSELFVIEDTTAGWAPNQEGVALFNVRLRVAAECPYAANRNETTSVGFFVNPDAVKDKAHPDYKKTLMALANMNNLLSACGIDLSAIDSQHDFGQYFDATEDGIKPLVGLRVWGMVENYSYVKRGQVDTTEGQSIRGFLPME